MWDFAAFNAPLGPERARVLVEWARGAAPERMVDVGCGWGELLARMVAALPGAVGVGVEHKAVLREQALRVASGHGVADRVRVVESLEGVGAAPWVSCVGSGHVFGSPVQMMQGLWRLCEPGGRVLVGEQYWRRHPVGSEWEGLYEGAALWQHALLPELVETATEQGFRPLSVYTATEAEWEEMENAHLAADEQWLLEHPAHERAPQVRAWADAFRRVRLGVGPRGRGTGAFLFLGVEGGAGWWIT